MRSRRKGMWWGVAIEAPDPAALARFYSALTEWPIVFEEPGTSVVAITQDGTVFATFQQADDYQPPAWPPVEGEQRTMMHLDIQVDDLEEAMGEAVALGARPAEHQPQHRVRVLFDPAGHPFCLCQED